MRRPAAVALVAAVALGLVACTGTAPTPPPDGPGGTSAATPEPVPPARTTVPAEPALVLDGATDAALAVQVSRTFFADAPAVVLTSTDVDPTGPAAVAVELGVPLLVAPDPPDGATAASTSASATSATTPPTPSGPASPTPPTATAGAADPVATEVTGEIERLGAATVVTVGAAAEQLAAELGGSVTVVPAPAGTSSVADLSPEGLPTGPGAPPVTAFAALALAGAEMAAARATVEAAGGVVHELAEPDPRTSSEVITALAADQPSVVVGLGPAFGSPEQLANRVEVAKTGVELPGGGQVLYPYHRHIALYGNPTTAALGSLGEQGLEESITRAKDLAAQYQAFTEQTTVPTFELIASVASSVPSSGGDYSTEMDPEVIRPYVDAARAAGVYVVLDLQPGRVDFLTQAKLYEEFLVQPHVGLALDPEWRLKPGQVHLEQVGTVTAAEVNSVVTWLADLTRQHALPQKILVLHQFRTEMISDRTQVDTTRDELAVLIHVDGFGPTGSKFATWRNIRADSPPNVWWGWKNFIDEDSPLMTPEATMQVDPVPQFVSYQ